MKRYFSKSSERVRILDLYRSLLRIHKSWPEEPNRPGRNLKDYLGRIFHRDFKALRNDLNAVQTDFIVNYEKDLVALKNIRADKYLKKVCRKIKSIFFEKFNVWIPYFSFFYQHPIPANFKPVHRPAYKLLSSEARSAQSKITPYSLFIPMISTWIKYKWDGLFNRKKAT